MFEKILERLEFYTTKIHNIYKNLKSQDQLRLVDRYFKKIEALIPKPIIIRNAQTIQKVMDIKFKAAEKSFIYYGKTYGIDFLNILMFIHGVAQSNPATAQRLKFAYSLVEEDFNKKEGIQYRMFMRFLGNFDFNLLSSMEFLLKNCAPEIMEKKRSVNLNSYEFLEIIKQFIEEFDDYLTNKRQLLLSSINHLYEYSLVLGPGFYTYFRVAFKSEEIKDLADKKAEMYLDYDIDNDEPDFDVLLQEFSPVNELWFKKTGYYMKNFVSTIKLIGELIIHRYHSFFSFKHLTLKGGASLAESKQNFYDYIRNIIKHYLENSELEDTFINLSDLRKLIASEITTITKGEIAKIIRELCIDPQKPYIPLFNVMASRFLYPVNNNRAFLFINNIFNALNERFYFELANISENQKEKVFLIPIINVLKENGYRVHPLSGHQIYDNIKKKNLGEIDIIATKGEYLLYIESKIMSQKSVSPYNYNSLEDKFRSIEKKLKKFDKNISFFNRYCHDPDTLNHFQKYTAFETLEPSHYTKKKYFFITPYLTYQPLSFKTEHEIELINLSILNSRIRNSV